MCAWRYACNMLDVIYVHEDVYVLSDIIRWIYPCSMWYIYILNAIGWHVDIDVWCIMLIWRHTCVMQYIYMKTYMHYVIYLHDDTHALAIYSHYVIYLHEDFNYHVIYEHEDAHIFCNICTWKYACIL